MGNIDNYWLLLQRHVFHVDFVTSMHVFVSLLTTLILLLIWSGGLITMVLAWQWLGHSMR